VHEVPGPRISDRRFVGCWAWCLRANVPGCARQRFAFCSASEADAAAEGSRGEHVTGTHATHSAMHARDERRRRQQIARHCSTYMYEQQATRPRKPQGAEMDIGGQPTWTASWSSWRIDGRRPIGEQTTADGSGNIGARAAEVRAATCGTSGHKSPGPCRRFDVRKTTLTPAKTE
jgi:hypothetical protein